MQTMMSRQPNRWTAEEDAILYEEAMKQAASGAVKDWNCIAERLPGRTNKDCRKRWINKVCGGLKRGTWSEAEDETLRAAVETYGQRWTQVAKVCGGRSPDQCAKRWQFTLDPKLDHREWTAEEDKLLLRLVKTVGRDWKLICSKHYPTRSRNDLKNRHTILSRRSLSEQPAPESAKTDSNTLLAGPEFTAERSVASAPESVVDASASSEYLDLDCGSPIWHPDAQIEQYDNDESCRDGDNLLDLDMNFHSDANLFAPPSRSSDGHGDIDTVASSSSSSNVLLPALDFSTLPSYGGDMSGNGMTLSTASGSPSGDCSMFDASSGDTHYGNLQFGSGLDMDTLYSADAMQAVAAGGFPRSVDSSVSKVVLVVEECDADMVKYLIDVTRRLRGKVKMEMTL